MFFSESVKSIRRNKFFSIVIVIQLLCSYFCLIIGVDIFMSRIVGKQIDVNKIFDKNKTIYLKPASVFDTLSAFSDETMNKLYEYYCSIKNDKNIAKVGVPVSSEKGDIEIFDLKFLTDNRLEGFSNLIYSDINFYQYMDNYKVEAGRKLNDKDFEKSNGEIIPIIISRDLKPFLKLGQIYAGHYEIVGILSEGSKLYYNNKDDVFSGVTQEPYTIIIPLNYKDPQNKNDFIHNLLLNMFVDVNNSSLKDDYTQKLTGELSKLSGIQFKAISMEENKNKYMDSQKYGAIVSASLAALLIIFSFFGTTGVILTTMLRRSKEFGVKLSVGWSLKDISRQIFLEILSLTLLSFSLAGILIKLFIKPLDPYDNYILNTTTYIVSFIIIVLLTFLYAVLPLKRIKKMSVVQLIKDVR